MLLSEISPCLPEDKPVAPTNRSYYPAKYVANVKKASTVNLNDVFPKPTNRKVPTWFKKTYPQYVAMLTQAIQENRCTWKRCQYVVNESSKKSKKLTRHFLSHLFSNPSIHDICSSEHGSPQGFKSPENDQNGK